MFFSNSLVQRLFLRTIVLLIGVSFIVFTGCQGKKRPDGFPKLYSVTLEVLQKGQPAEGVAITLVSKNQSVPWAVGGKTDASGKAILVTHGQYRGVPNGEYSVIMSKTETDNIDELLAGPDETKRQDKADQNKSYKTYSLIETKYNDAKTSDLELKVEGKSINQTFDLGPAVKVLISTYRPGSL